MIVWHYDSSAYERTISGGKLYVAAQTTLLPTSCEVEPKSERSDDSRASSLKYSIENVAHALSNVIEAFMSGAICGDRQ